MIGAVYPGQVAPAVDSLLGALVVSDVISVSASGSVGVASSAINPNRIQSGILAVVGEGIIQNGIRPTPSGSMPKPQIDATFLRQFPIHRNRIRRS